VTIDVQALLGELNERRTPDRMDVALMTLVAYFEDANVGAWLRDRLQSLAAKDPARVIFLDATQPAGAQTVSAEWLELGVAGEDPDVLQSVVASLTLPQVPVVLVWASKHVAGDARFSALASLARTVVYNSSALGTDDSGLRALVEFERAHPEMLVSDVAYLRLAGWQESIALFFDGKNVIRELFDLRRVEITSGSAAEAYYLLGWLASRLEWKPCACDRFCNRFGTEIAFTLAHDGPPRRIRRVALHSTQSHFLAELQPGDPGAIELTVEGAAQHEARCHPLSDAGTAALIERAILTGRQDRIFQDTLAAAGEILARQEAAR
jgi:glucose-6-phosphate dehydrogenase assembly protein OpcA